MTPDEFRTAIQKIDCPKCAEHLLRQNLPGHGRETFDLAFHSGVHIVWDISYIDHLFNTWGRSWQAITVTPTDEGYVTVGESTARNITTPDHYQHLIGSPPRPAYVVDIDPELGTGKAVIDGNHRLYGAYVSRLDMEVVVVPSSVEFPARLGKSIHPRGWLPGVVVGLVAHELIRPDQYEAALTYGRIVIERFPQLLDD